MVENSNQNSLNQYTSTKNIFDLTYTLKIKGTPPELMDPSISKASSFQPLSPHSKSHPTHFSDPSSDYEKWR